jgi:hypothetical protein
VVRRFRTRFYKGFKKVLENPEKDFVCPKLDKKRFAVYLEALRIEKAYF